MFSMKEAAHLNSALAQIKHLPLVSPLWGRREQLDAITSVMGPPCWKPLLVLFRVPNPVVCIGLITVACCPGPSPSLYIPPDSGLTLTGQLGPRRARMLVYPPMETGEEADPFKIRAA